MFLKDGKSNPLHWACYYGDYCLVEVSSILLISIILKLFLRLFFNFVDLFNFLFYKSITPSKSIDEWVVL